MTCGKWLVLLGLVGIACFPVAARAQTGACGAEIFDEFEFSLCVDGLTAADCLDLCDEDCEFFPGETCAEVGPPWDGACEADDSPIGPLCALLWTEPNGVTSDELCEEGFILGTWLGDGSTCQQVPTLPKVGQAALVLILLVGALVILTLQGTIRAA